MLMSKLCSRLTQHYVLAIMIMTGLAFLTIDSLSFTFLLKTLLYKDKIEYKDSACPSFEGLRENHTSGGNEEFFWGTQLQEYIHYADYTGSLLARLPSGLVVDRYGAKTVVGYVIFIGGVCTLLTPLCARTSPYAMMANRMLMESFHSAVYLAIAWFAARWFPSNYLFRLLSIILFGLSMGSIIFRYVAYLYEENNWRWTSMYYIIGGLTIMWAFIWQAVVCDDPFEHPYISYHELEMLTDKVPMYANDCELEPGWSWPWWAMLTSPAVWTLTVGEIGIFWYYNFVTSTIPLNYFSEVHQYNFNTKDKLSMFLFLLTASVMVAAGVAADKMIEKRVFNLTHITKIYLGLSSILGSVLVIGLVVYAQCHLTSALIYYTSCMACLGISLPVTLAMVTTIAPNFAATVYAMVTIPPTISLLLLSKLDSMITVHSTLQEWKTMTYLSAAIIMLTTAIFIRAGDCRLQPWNEPQKIQHQKVRNEQEASKHKGKPAKPVEQFNVSEQGSSTGQPSLGSRYTNIMSTHSLAKSMKSIMKENAQLPKQKSQQSSKYTF